MGPSWILLLALAQLHASIRSEILDTRNLNDIVADSLEEQISPNKASIEVADLIPFVSNNGIEETELSFKYPINSIGIDYGKNLIKLGFQQTHDADDELRRSLEKNFMRFGKRAMEELPLVNSNDLEFYEPEQELEEPMQRSTRSSTRGRDSRGDNFMRFGRAAKDDFMRFGRDPKDDFMRFGRDPKQDFMRFGRAAKEDFMRFGRDPKQDFMRFGRNPQQDFMRFGRSAKEDFMRFGRSPKDFMRFGRNPKEDFMRFGRNPKEDFMRFGRNPKEDFMRFGRNPKEDFMRFGRNPKEDFMRFGRDPKQDFMRFGRNPREDFMRFGRDMSLKTLPDKNFMRFGRPDNFMRFGRSGPPEPLDKSANFMRFGKSLHHAVNNLQHQNAQNTTQLQKNEIKEAAKLLKQASDEHIVDESNPMDKAISALFQKQQQHQQQQQQQQQEQQNEQTGSEPNGNNDDFSSEQYFTI